MENNTHRLHVHIDKKLMSKLKRRAKRDKRTVTATVNLALAQYLIDRAESN